LTLSTALFEPDFETILLSMASRLVKRDSGKVWIDNRELVIEKSIAYLDLFKIENKYLDELSGGQKQLAFIAMVIAQDTDYVFLDEPLNNLDIKHSLQIMDSIQILVHELNKAVVVVIHDINFASCYSYQIMALKKGNVVATASVEDVIQEDILEDIYETPFKIVELEGKRMCLYHTH